MNHTASPHLAASSSANLDRLVPAFNPFRSRRYTLNPEASEFGPSLGISIEEEHPLLSAKSLESKVTATSHSRISSPTPSTQNLLTMKLLPFPRTFTHSFTSTPKVLFLIVSYFQSRTCMPLQFPKHG